MRERIYPSPEQETTHLVSLLSPKRLVRRIRELKQYIDLNWPSFQPPLEHGSGRLSLPSSADGPIATLARIEQNVRAGLPADDGLPPDALNNPNSP